MKTRTLDCSILTQIEFFARMKKYKDSHVIVISNAGSYIHQVIIKCALDGTLIETTNEVDTWFSFTSKIVITCPGVEFFVHSRMINVNDVLVSMPRYTEKQFCTKP